MTSWIEPNWDKEYDEFETMASRGVVDNAARVFRVARTTGRPVVLRLDDPRWARMKNTTSGRGLTWSEAKVEAAANGHVIDGLFERFLTGGDVQMPIVMVNESGSLYKVAGNHRLMACRALGIHPTVWAFQYPVVVSDVLRQLVREVVLASMCDRTSCVAPVLADVLSLPMSRPTYDKSTFASDSSIVELPDDAYHVTLIGKQMLKSVLSQLKTSWDDFTRQLPRVPDVKLSTVPQLATRDNGKKTWFLAVTNQHEVQSYVDAIENAVRLYVPDYPGDECRFFHVVVANNCDGDPRSSIDDVCEDDVEQPTQHNSYSL